MKTRSSFLKKKKTLIITLWLLIVLAIAITLVALFLKQDDTSKAAEIQEGISTASGLQAQTDNGLVNQNNVDGENQETNGNNDEVNPQNENGENNNQTNTDINSENGTENNENTATGNGLNTNNEENINQNDGNVNLNANNGNANNQNNTNINNQNVNGADQNNTNNMELQEIITFEDKLVSEDFLVGWTPISILALASSAERNIHAPQLEIEKHSYSEREFTVTPNGIEVKESKNDLVYEGEAILYEITVRNIGNVDANNIRIYDMAPEQTTLLQVDSSAVMKENGLMCWTVNIPKYTEIKVRFLVTVNEDAKGTITNTALVNGEETNETQNPIIEISKQVIQTEPLYEGEEVEYIITVTNTGNIDTTINVEDEIPSEITYIIDSANYDAQLIEENGVSILKWSNISLEKEQTKQFIFKGTVNVLPEGVFSEDILNTALVNGKETNEVKNEVIKPNIIKEKKSSVEGNVHENDVITYTIIAGNTGTGAKTIEISDIVPEGTTFKEVLTYNEMATLVYEGNNVIGIKWNVTLEPQDNKEFQFSVLVNELPQNTYSKQIKNVAIVDEENTNEVENTVIKPFITREKKNSVQGNVHEDDIITYTIIASNIGTEAKEIEVVDYAPEGTTFEKIESYEELSTKIENNGSTVGVKWIVTLEPQDSKEFKFSVKVNKLEDGIYTTDIKNKALVDEVETNEVENIVVKPYITRLKENTPSDKVHEGETITYTITAGNIGTEAKEIEVVDYAPEGTTFTSIDTYEELATEIKDGDKVIGVTWKVTLQPGDSKQFKFTVTVDNLGKDENGNDVYGKDILNKALVDNIETNEVTNKVVKPCITRLKENSPSDKVHEGETITYTITAGNIGTEAKEIEVIDYAPEGTTFTSIDTYEELATEIKDGDKVIGVTWKVTLQPGDSKQFKFTVTVDNLGKDENGNDVYGRDILNKAIVDEVETNEVTNKVVKPCITRLKENTPSGNVHEGETITYTITAGNIGTEEKEIEIVDYAPEGTTFTSIDTYEELATEIKEGDKVVGVIWKVNVKPSESKEFKFTVTVNNLPTGVYGKEITNEALVDKIATNKVTNNVVKPNITSEKTSDIEDGSNVKYGQEIEYTITVTNSGTEDKVVNITDSIPEYTEFVSVSEGGETIVDPTTQKVTGVKWSKNVAARTSISNPTSISVTFKVKVIGEVTKTISNTAKVDGANTNTVTHKIDKIITTQGKNTGKNIVVVLDLSSSMLNTAYGKEYLGTGDYYDDSKLELAKDALQTFTTAALAEDLGNTITLITFNYDSYDNNVKKALANAWRAQAIADAGSDVHKHIGTKVLVSKTNNAQTINTAVEGIKLERPLLTNIYEALKLTNTTIDNLKASEPNKDVVVVFIGDGKSSYSTDSGAWVNENGDTLCKFDTRENTLDKIEDICLGKAATSTTSRIVGIREKATVYTVEYNVPNKEKDDAREVFTKIASDSDKRFIVDENGTNETVEALNEKLTAIATDIGAPKVISKTTNVNGIVTFDIAENANLFVSTSKKLIISLGGNKTPLEFDSIEAIGIDYEATGRIKYDETNKQIIIDATKFSADSQISVQYYYSK